MDWKRWSLRFLKGFFGSFLFFFLVMSGWLLHILETTSRSVINAKKNFDKRAAGAGTVASLVSKPVLMYTQKGRKAIRGYLHWTLSLRELH